MLHTLRVAAHRTLKLVRADLETLGVPESAYDGVNMPRTQEIGAAVEFLGCDGLIAPCARWSCDNLILFPDRMGVDANLEIVQSEAVDWVAWATTNGLIDGPKPRQADTLPTTTKGRSKAAQHGLFTFTLGGVDRHRACHS